MITSQQMSPGMVLSLEGKLFRVESVAKVAVADGPAFIKAKLRNLATDKVLEKNFKMGQEVKDVALEERKLEYLYMEGKNYLFLDVGNLEQVLVTPEVVGDKVHFLKAGIEITAAFYGDTIFSIELPQFLELMVVKTEPVLETTSVAHATKEAVLETGAAIRVLMFIQEGDVVKVDTRTKEFIQRI